MAVSASALRSLLWSAFRAGGLVAFGLFCSSRSPSGCSCRLAFASWSAASGFARRWSARLGLPVAVRRSVRGWVVSVPVVRPLALPSRSLGSWRRLGGVCGGGLRGFVRLVRLWSAGVV